MIVTMNRSFREKKKTALNFIFLVIVEKLIKKKTSKIIVFFLFFAFKFLTNQTPLLLSILPLF